MKHKRKLVPFLQILVGAVVGALIGVLSMVITDGDVTAVMCVLPAIVVSIYVHLVVHEGGHLVFGLLSGYKFVSFRAGHTIFVRQGEKIVRRKFTLMGTGGQCLLDPPERDADGQFPAVLYNLGGGLFNLLFGVCGFMVMGLCPHSNVIRVSGFIFGIFGFYLGASNLIPMKVGGIANDGYNMKTFRNDRESADAFWLQMRINRLQQTDGQRLCEMPEDYFRLPETDFSGNPLIEAIAVMAMQRELEQGAVAEGAARGRALLSSNKLMGFFRYQIEMELLFLELIGACRAEEVNRLYSKQLRNFLKAMKYSPSAHRVLYAYAKRFSKDEKEAQKEKYAFEKTLKTYPTLGEIRTEQAWMEEI